MPRKGFAVIWNKDSMPFYGVKKGQELITVESKEEIKVNVSKSKIGRPKIRYAEPLAIFQEIQEAEAYRANNKDFLVVPCTLILHLTTNQS